MAVDKRQFEVTSKFRSRPNAGRISSDGSRRAPWPKRQDAASTLGTKSTSTGFAQQVVDRFVCERKIFFARWPNDSRRFSAGRRVLEKEYFFWFDTAAGTGTICITE
jgi:hypothetical protein